MRKSNAWILACALGLTLGAATHVAAEQASSPSTMNEQTATGTLTAVDAGTKSVTVKGEKEQWTFVTDSSTQILKRDAKAAWDDLTSGQKVTVAYRMQGSQKLAVKISISG